MPINHAIWTLGAHPQLLPITRLPSEGFLKGMIMRSPQGRSGGSQGEMATPAESCRPGLADLGGSDLPILARSSGGGMFRRAMLGTACMLLSAGVLGQELRCTQMFMSPAEKTICASNALMGLDKEMSLLAHRAEKTQPGYRSDQREFRRELKECKAEASCLEATYLERIAALTVFVNTLPPPSAAEEERLSKEAQKAQLKRDAQAERRAQLAEEMDRTEVAGVNGESDTEQLQTVVVTPTDEVSDEQGGDEVLEPSSESSPIVNSSETNPDSAAAVPPAGPDLFSWAIIAALGIAALVFVAFIFSALDKRSKRCPKCGRWDAGNVIDTSERSYTDYEMRTFEDEKRNARGIKTGSVRKQRQIAVKKTAVTRTWECAHCSNEWATTETIRG